MKCNEFNEKLSLYIDNQLSNIEKKEFEIHLHECEECRKEYKETIDIIKLTGEIEEVELPNNYRTTLREKLEEEKKTNKVRRINFRVLTSVAATLLLIVISSGMILNYLNYNGTKDQALDDMPKTETQYSTEAKYGRSQLNNGINFDSAVEKSEVAPNITSINDENMNALVVEGTQKSRGTDEVTLTSDGVESLRKIIKDGFITLETKEFEKSYDKIIDYAKSYRGYIEWSETMYGKVILEKNQEPLRNGRLRIRIPEDNFESALTYFKSLGKVKSQQLNERDISKIYYDTENLVRNLELQEKRLREILEEAKNVDEILRVENELRRIRTEINRNKQTLKNWDSLISYSTIDISLLEIREQGEKIELNDDEGILVKGKKGFISTINKIIDFVGKTIVLAMTITPILTPLFIILIVILIIIRRNTKRKK